MHTKRTAIFVITFCLVGLFTNAPVFAQEASDSSTPVSTYDLSYPGLLPDHPLYFLKMARDNLTAFFIDKPLDKAEFDLKQSDKHVSASVAMVTQKKDISLAQTSFADSQNYFEEAIDQTTIAQKQGVDIHAMTNNLQDASKKYIEVLSQIESSLSADEKKQFESDEKNADLLIKSAASIKP